MLLQASSFIKHLFDAIESLGDQLSKYHEPCWQYIDTLHHIDKIMKIPPDLTTEFVCHVFEGSQKQWDTIFSTHKMQDQVIKSPNVWKAVNEDGTVFMTWLKGDHGSNRIEVRFYQVKSSKQAKPRQQN